MTGASRSILLLTCVLFAPVAAINRVPPPSVTALAADAASTSDPVVGGVHVNPPNWEDWTRGREPLGLFSAGAAPGAALQYGGSSLSATQEEPESFERCPTDDPVGMQCAPGGHAVGHYFYNVKDPELVPFIVPHDQPKRTDMAVIIAPGGGYVHLAWEPSGVGPAEWFNSIGISAFVLKYRVPDANGDLQVMDVQRAMSLVRHVAPGYGLNASRVGFMGASASGGLALKLGSLEERQYPRIDDVDDIAFHPDFMIAMFPANADYVTPERAAKMPTMFMAHAADDPCVHSDDMNTLAGKMKRYGTKPFLYHEYPDGRHGWVTCEYYPDTLMGMEMCDWKKLAEPFLRKEVLGEK